MHELTIALTISMFLTGVAFTQYDVDAIVDRASIKIAAYDQRIITSQSEVYELMTGTSISHLSLEEQREILTKEGFIK